MNNGEIIRETIAQTDYYICIIGHRYGSLTADGGSFTEREWDYAKELGVPIMSFIRERDVATKPNERDAEPDQIARLDRFIEKAKASKMVDFWKDADELYTKAITALHKSFARKPRPGWIRAESESVAEQLAVLVDENRSLRGQVERLTSEIKQTAPAFRVLLNGEANLSLKFVEDGDLHLPSMPDLSPLVWSDVADELKRFVSEEDIEKYNESLPSREQMEERLAEVRRIRRFQDTAVKLNIEITNTGSAKAREVYLDLQFPTDAALVIDEDDLKDLKVPKLGLPKNPVEAAENELAVRRLGRDGPWMPSSSIPQLLRTTPPTFEFSRHILSPSRSLKVERNKVSMWLQDLMHTRRAVFNEALIVPLKLGSFEINGSLICEEIGAPHELTFPLSITPGSAEDVRTTLKARFAVKNSVLND